MNKYYAINQMLFLVKEGELLSSISFRSNEL